MRAHLGEAPGPTVEAETGARVGAHKGLWFHTVGQRRGLGRAIDAREVHRGPWCESARAAARVRARRLDGSERLARDAPARARSLPLS